MSQSKREVGELNLELEKTTFNEGENVKGTVKLKVAEQYSGESVFLLLIGKMFAKTYRHQLNEKTASWEDINLKEDSKNLLCQRYELFNFNKQSDERSQKETTQHSTRQTNEKIILPGEYSIQFSFALPAALEHSSTACKGAFGVSKDISDHYDFYVKYFVEAFVPTNDSSLVPFKHRTIMNVICNDVITRKMPTGALLREHKIIVGGGCFCFTSDLCIVKTKLDKLSVKSSEALTIQLEIDNSTSSREITKISYEVKRILLFKKSNYVCSKGLYSGQQQLNLPAKQKMNSSIVCNLPLALALSHNSALVSLKYSIEFSVYSGNQLLEVFQHDFFVEPNSAQEKWEDKTEGKGEGENDSDSEDDDSQENGNNEQQMNYLKANSTVNWQRCKSTIDYYYNNIDNFRKIQSFTNTQNPPSP